MFSALKMIAKEQLLQSLSLLIESMSEKIGGGFTESEIAGGGLNQRLPAPQVVCIPQTEMAWIIDHYGNLLDHTQAKNYIAALTAFYEIVTPEEISAANQYPELKADIEHEKRIDQLPPANRPGWVYLLASSLGYYKIGCTKNPESRMKAFAAQLTFHATYIALIKTDDMVKLERKLHIRFGAKCIDGEWFDLEDADVEYIKSLAEVGS